MPVRFSSSLPVSPTLATTRSEPVEQALAISSGMTAKDAAVSVRVAARATPRMCLDIDTFLQACLCEA